MPKILEVLHQNYHMQGFTTDPEQRYMYWSFTDSVVKTNYESTVIAQCHVSGGHLGDIGYYQGKLYASYLGNALPGHAWDDWTSFKIYVFDAEDLRPERIIDMPICDEMKANENNPRDEFGFRAIDGVTFGKDTDGNEKLFVACALRNGEQFRNQMVLQLSLDGVYEMTHRIETGNTVFGIQTLDYDRETGEFWFTTYGKSEPYQAEETLFRIAPDLKTIRAKYKYSSPYGFACLGGGKYFASIQSGKNANQQGYAYECEESLFRANKSEKEICDFVFGGNHI